MFSLGQGELVHSVETIAPKCLCTTKCLCTIAPKMEGEGGGEGGRWRGSEGYKSVLFHKTKITVLHFCLHFQNIAWLPRSLA